MDIGAFSYRLKIAVEPQWAEIIKQVVGLRDHYEQKEFAKKLTDLPDDRMLHPVVIALRKTPHHRQPLRPGASGCRYLRSRTISSKRTRPLSVQRTKMSLNI